MRVLVTGADGFVGGHLCRLFEEDGATVVRLFGAVDRPVDDRTGAIVVDIRDFESVRRSMELAHPDAIVHLAGISSVAYSHAEPGDTFAVNVLGTLNVCLAAKSAAPRARVLVVSSGEVYGSMVPGAQATEDSPLAPSSPYAASKVGAEAVALQFARSYGINVVCARPFSHLGAGQAPSFAIPSFARQLKEFRRDAGRATIYVGNLEPIRDFSHVRDVVVAYRLLLERGNSGEIYNVCSGVGRSVRSVLDELIELAGIEVDVRVDPLKFRPADLLCLVGSSEKVRALGWAPRCAVRDALRDVLREAHTP